MGTHLNNSVGVCSFNATRITAWKQQCENNQGRQLTAEEDNRPRSSGKHSCGSTKERVQSGKWKAGYRMAASRPLALNGLRHLQRCHNEESWHPTVRPTALRVLSRTLLRQSEMWRSHSWKWHLSLGLKCLPKSPSKVWACTLGHLAAWLQNTHDPQFTL